MSLAHCRRRAFFSALVSSIISSSCSSVLLVVWICFSSSAIVSCKFSIISEEVSRTICRYAFTIAVGFFEVAPAHREHRTAAVAAHHQAGVGVGVYPGAAVVVARALLHGVLRGRIYAVVDDGFVVFEEDDVVAFVALDVLSVDLLARVFSLPKCADVEIVC